MPHSGHTGDRTAWPVNEDAGAPLTVLPHVLSVQLAIELLDGDRDHDRLSGDGRIPRHRVDRDCIRTCCRLFYRRATARAPRDGERTKCQHAQEQSYRTASARSQKPNQQEARKHRACRADMRYRCCMVCRVALRHDGDGYSRSLGGGKCDARLVEVAAGIDWKARTGKCHRSGKGLIGGEGEDGASACSVLHGKGRDVGG